MGFVLDTEQTSAAKVSTQAAPPPGDEAASPLKTDRVPDRPHFGSYAGGRHHFGAEGAAPRPAGCDGREVG